MAIALTFLISVNCAFLVLILNFSILLLISSLINSGSCCSRFKPLELRELRLLNRLWLLPRMLARSLLPAAIILVLRPWNPHAVGCRCRETLNADSVAIRPREEEPLSMRLSMRKLGELGSLLPIQPSDDPRFVLPIPIVPNLFNGIYYGDDGRSFTTSISYSGLPSELSSTSLLLSFISYDSCSLDDLSLDLFWFIWYGIL